MSVQATPLDLRQVYQWAIEINGFTASFFSECDMPNPEIESVSFDGAGTVHAINNPGRVKFNPITAKKGLWLGGADAKAWSWLQRAVDWNTGKTSAPSKVKQDIDLLHLDGSGATIETFTLKGACSPTEGDYQQPRPNAAITLVGAAQSNHPRSGTPVGDAEITLGRGRPNACRALRAMPSAQSTLS